MVNEYKPAIELITELSNHKISISVKDNGNGIPQHIIEKIFDHYLLQSQQGRGQVLDYH
ncbi:MAG: ATP-binding protein [Bacteroidia bacterium]